MEPVGVGNKSVVVCVPAGDRGVITPVGSEVTSLLRNYALVMNLGALPRRSLREILPGYILCSATDAEVGEIRAVVGLHGGQVPSHFEGNLIDGRWVSLPPGKKRYYIIAFDGSNNVVARLCDAMLLYAKPIIVGFTALTNSPGVRSKIYSPGQLTSMIDEFQWNSELVTIDRHDVKAISEIAMRLLTHDESKISLNHPIEQLRHIRNLPNNSHLRFLGLFAILESILTHQPRDIDTIDSITRQIKMKLLLLNNRWSPKLDYSPFGVEHEKLWSIMYKYRSQAAHGGKIDFTGDLRILQSVPLAHKLLYSAVSRVICQALLEPQLIADLQRC